MTGSVTLAELAEWVQAQSWGSAEARTYGDRVGRLVPGHSEAAPVRLMKGGGRGRPRTYESISQHTLDNGLLEIKANTGRYLPAAEVIN